MRHCTSYAHGKPAREVRRRRAWWFSPGIDPGMSVDKRALRYGLSVPRYSSPDGAVKHHHCVTCRIPFVRLIHRIAKCALNVLTNLRAPNKLDHHQESEVASAFQLTFEAI